MSPGAPSLTDSLPSAHEFGRRLFARALNPQGQLFRQGLGHEEIEALYTAAQEIVEGQAIETVEDAECLRNRLKDRLPTDFDYSILENMDLILLGIIGEASGIQLESLMDGLFSELTPPQSMQDRVAGANAIGQEIARLTGNLTEALARTASTISDQPGGRFKLF